MSVASPLVALAVALTTPAAPPPAPAVSLRLRVDPIVSVVGGASVGFDVAPVGHNSRLSVAAFVVDVPRFLVGAVVPSAPTPQRLKLTETCVQLGWFTSSEPGHRGFFFGPELFAYRLRYVDEARPARSAVARELYAHATAGFVWFPFAERDGVLGEVFVMPWATLGLPLWGEGGAVFADGTAIADRVANVHATVSIGLQLF